MYKEGSLILVLSAVFVLFIITSPAQASHNTGQNCTQNSDCNMCHDSCIWAPYCGGPNQETPGKCPASGGGGCCGAFFPVGGTCDPDGVKNYNPSDSFSYGGACRPLKEYGATGSYASVCKDGKDNDKDGLTDCADSDCSFLTECQDSPPTISVSLNPITQYAGLSTNITVTITDDKGISSASWKDDKYIQTPISIPCSGTICNYINSLTTVARPYIITVTATDSSGQVSTASASGTMLSCSSDSQCGGITYPGSRSCSGNKIVQPRAARLCTSFNSCSYEYSGSYVIEDCALSGKTCSSANGTVQCGSISTTPGAGAPEPSNNEPGVWAQVEIATGKVLTTTICTKSVCGLNGEWHGYVPPGSYSSGSVWWPTSMRYIWQLQGQAGYGSATFDFNTYIFTVPGGTIYNGQFTPTVSSNATSQPSSNITTPLDVSSTPSGATVTNINTGSVYCQSTPCYVPVVTVPSNSVNIRISKAGYYDWTNLVYFYSGETTIVNATLLQITTSTITPSSSPTSIPIYPSPTYSPYQPPSLSCNTDSDCSWTVTNGCPESAGANWQCGSLLQPLPKYISTACPNAISLKPSLNCGCIQSRCSVFQFEKPTEPPRKIGNTDFDTTKLFAAVIQMEQLTVKFNFLKSATNKLTNYYNSTGNTVAYNIWLSASQMIEQGIKRIQDLRTEVRNKLDTFTIQDLRKLKTDIKSVIDIIKEIVRSVLSLPPSTPGPGSPRGGDTNQTSGGGSNSSYPANRTNQTIPIPPINQTNQTNGSIPSSGGGGQGNSTNQTNQSGGSPRFPDNQTNQTSGGGSSSGNLTIPTGPSGGSNQTNQTNTSIPSSGGGGQGNSTNQTNNTG